MTPRERLWMERNFQSIRASISVVIDALAACEASSYATKEIIAALQERPNLKKEQVLKLWKQESDKHHRLALSLSRSIIAQILRDAKGKKKKTKKPSGPSFSLN